MNLKASESVIRGQPSFIRHCCLLPSNCLIRSLSVSLCAPVNVCAFVCNHRVDTATTTTTTTTSTNQQSSTTQHTLHTTNNNHHQPTTEHHTVKRRSLTLEEVQGLESMDPNLEEPLKARLRRESRQGGLFFSSGPVRAETYFRADRCIFLFRWFPFITCLYTILTTLNQNSFSPLSHTARSAREVVEITFGGCSTEP